VDAVEPSDPPGLQNTIGDPDFAGARDDEAPLECGTSVGRYVLLQPIGQGGMGIVYGAYDPELDRKVALKVLHRDQSHRDNDTQGALRLVREARAMASSSHPNVVSVHDVGTVRGRVFIAMELVDGQSLTQWLAAQPRPWREVVRVFVEAGRGLAAAHTVGMVHRDFKPDNVLVGKDGRVRVTDFGLAYQVGRGGARSVTTSNSVGRTITAACTSQR
jgi:eukaryotic-like serine/threonine-protein kinase